jgi:glycosyltransferase involved in cell wall biosynthesis
MSTPKITVLMPVYNGEKYIREAITSILIQTFSDFEFLIINDGSTDNSVSVIESFKDERIRLINNEKNIGIISTLNKGIELARGEYIARMDCDDISLPERLQKQMRFLEENHTVCVVSSHVEMIDDNGISKGNWAEDMKTNTQEEIHSMLPRENCIAHPTVTVRKAVMKLFKYNKTLKKCEDWGLWLSLLSNGYKIAKLDEVLLRYRIHAGGTTVQANKEGVRKKIIQFKFFYLISKLKKLNVKGTDYTVFKSLFTDSARYFLPFLYALLGRVYSTNPVKLCKQFMAARKIFAAPDGISHIFFFPFYHIGGAESAHASIVETMANKKPLVLFTSASGDSTYLEEFKKSARVLDVAELLNWPGTKNWLVKKINTVCGGTNQVYLFGCNSRFFYELLPRLRAETKAIDLIHAFMHEYEDGAEKWSLPVADKLYKRIVSNNLTGENLKELYKRNNIPGHLTDRIVCIPNYTDEKKYIEKPRDGKLCIIYIGRGTKEKRVELIALAAKILADKNIPAKISFSGGVRNSIPAEYLPYCSFLAASLDKARLDTVYFDSHILILSSSREGFPLVIMEAMMHGVVPISTNVGGIAEHLNNKNGVLINATESDKIVEDIVNAIEWLSKDRNKLAELSVQAYNYALANFGKKGFIESYTKLLNS